MNNGETVNESASIPCIKLILPADLGFLRVVDRVSDSVGEYMGFDEAERNAIAISAVEAVTNAIQHGCGSDETKCVTMSYCMEGDLLRIAVQDPGAGFDPDANECAMEETGVCRGRGIAIMKSFMDEVLFDFDEGTLTTLLKRRSSASQSTGTEGMGRVMGIDFGDRRFGVAVSDPRGLVAGSPSVLHVKDQQEAISRIREIAEEEDIAEIVVGFPLSLSGVEGPQAEKVKEFASTLSRACGIRVALWDERFSTAEVERLLLLQDKKTRKQKGKRDLMAAVLILQSYLDRRTRDERGGSTHPV